MENPDWTHGATLAIHLGGGMRFCASTVTSGDSFSDGESTGFFVYPERYQGLGGGVMRASMDGHAVFEMGDMEEAASLAEAFNHFAIEGREAEAESLQGTMQ